MSVRSAMISAPLAIAEATSSVWARVSLSRPLDAVPILGA
jgi:hypothetical protein